MSVLWFGDLDGVPLDEAKVRATTGPVEKDAPPAEMENAPDFNEVDTDSNPNLYGLAARQVASDWHESEQFTPWYAAGATAEHNEIINRQVATSGTAAAREMAGQQGPGTIGYAVGIEPVIRDGGAFGADYFAADKRDIQDPVIETGTGRGVQPAINRDRDKIAGMAAYGNQAARDANNNMSDWYAQILKG